MVRKKIGEKKNWCEKMFKKILDLKKIGEKKNWREKNWCKKMFKKILDLKKIGEKKTLPHSYLVSSVGYSSFVPE